MDDSTRAFCQASARILTRFRQPDVQELAANVRRVANHPVTERTCSPGERTYLSDAARKLEDAAELMSNAAKLLADISQEDTNAHS